MIIEYVRHKIPADTKQAFVDSYTKAGEMLRSSEHCLGYELSNGNEEPENYILRIEWDSLEGHNNGFRQSAAFKTFFQQVAPYFNSIQEMKHYDLTEVFWRK